MSLEFSVVAIRQVADDELLLGPHLDERHHQWQGMELVIHPILRKNN